MFQDVSLMRIALSRLYNTLCVFVSFRLRAWNHTCGGHPPDFYACWHCQTSPLLLQRFIDVLRHADCSREAVVYCTRSGLVPWCAPHVYERVHAWAEESVRRRTGGGFLHWHLHLVPMWEVHCREDVRREASWWTRAPRGIRREHIRCAMVWRQRHFSTRWEVLFLRLFSKRNID